MKTYYDLLNIPPRATTIEVHAIFRRFAAGYRPTITAEQIFTDTRFINVVNAYLTLHSEERKQYDDAMKAAGEKDFPQPTPLDAATLTERRMLQAHVAIWRREMTEAIHLLRTLLDREPEYAPAWALLGEAYFIIDRLSEGITAYERAVKANPRESTYADRLQQARDALAGKIELPIEASPEEELLREQRRKRWRVTALISLFGVAAIVYSFIYHITPASLGFLGVPWKSIVLQAVGASLLVAALAYGRVLESFERVMVWSSSVRASRHSTVHSLPNGLMLFVASVISLWLAVGAFIVMSAIDDEWPVSTIIVISLCVAMNLGLAALLFFGVHLPCGGTIVYGGNLVILASLLGWWIGSYDAPQYD